MNMIAKILYISGLIVSLYLYTYGIYTILIDFDPLPSGLGISLFMLTQILNEHFIDRKRRGN